MSLQNITNGMNNIQNLYIPFDVFERFILNGLLWFILGFLFVIIVNILAKYIKKRGNKCK